MLVDEFQDTNTAQYELVQMLAGRSHNLFAVGDEDQSIFGFRGADYRNVVRFREDFPEAKVILLEQNYRSTQTILDTANAIIAHNMHRTPKELRTDRGHGLQVVVHEAYDEGDEASFVVAEYRTACGAGGRAPERLRRDVPHQCAIAPTGRLRSWPAASLTAWWAVRVSISGERSRMRWHIFGWCTIRPTTSA